MSDKKKGPADRPEIPHDGEFDIDKRFQAFALSILQDKYTEDAVSQTIIDKTRVNQNNTGL